MSYFGESKHSSRKHIAFNDSRPLTCKSQLERSQTLSWTISPGMGHLVHRMSTQRSTSLTLFKEARPTKQTGSKYGTSRRSGSKHFASSIHLTIPKEPRLTTLKIPLTLQHHTGFNSRQFRSALAFIFGGRLYVVPEFAQGN